MDTSEHSRRTITSMDQDYFDSQGAGIFVVDFFTGGIVGINRKATQMLELSETDIIGKRSDLFLKTVNETPLKPSGTAVDGYLRGYQGKTIPVIIQTTKCKIREHNGMIHTFLEVPEGRRALIKKVTRSDRYLEVLNRMQDFLFYQTDIDGVMQDVSDLSFKITGYNRKEVIGKPATLLYLDTDDFKLMMKELLSKGFVENYKFDLKRKDGTTTDVMVSSNVIFDNNNKPESIFGIFHDTNRITRAIKSCGASEEKFRAVTQSTQDTIIMMNEKGLISFLNDAAIRMFGYTKKEMLGANLHELLAPKQYISSFKQGFKAFSKTGEGLVVGRTLEIEAKRKNGSIFPIELSISSLRLNNTWNAIGIIRDITDRRHTEQDIVEATEAAENASRTKSEFLANMSHEIRTPLNSIIGAADLLSETDLDKDQKKYLKMMRSSGKSLLALLNDILDISRIEAGKITLEKIDFNLKILLDKICDTLSVRSKRKNLELTHEIDTDVPTILTGDPNRLTQILVNLIGNAIKFTEAGSVDILVSILELSDQQAILNFSVSDTGMGIPIAKLESIFNSFTQADTSVTRKFGGTGLGLTISKKLVQLMQGEISAESQVDKGSVFSFTASFDIPEEGVKNEPDKTEKKIEIQEKASDLNNLRILLVDDSPDNRFLINAFLKKESCTIVEANNGSIAVDLFLSREWDIILMDMQMPVMDGYQATKKIRGIEKAKAMKHTPIVALTAHSINTEVKKCLDSGCDVHLAKPVNKTALIKLITDITSSGDSQKKTESSGKQVKSENHSRIRIHVDPDLMELIPGYIEHRNEDVAKMLDLLEKESYRKIERCGHSMKGTGGGYGFNEISKIGDFIENAGKAKDKILIQEGINQLKNFLEKLEIIEEE